MEALFKGASKEPFSLKMQQARLIASTIPSAVLVPLGSNNHVLSETEPAWRVFLEEVERFTKA
jgi:hypothetical protein